MPNRNSSSKSGFTLIELLVAISIVGILSGILISVINPVALRAKARDSQRKTDLKQIQTALELYFADFRRYPYSQSSLPCSGTCAWSQVSGSGPLTNALSPSSGAVYINSVPTDPLGQTGSNTGPCFLSNFYRYNYRTTADGGRYVVTALMESLTSDDEGRCEDLNNWGTLGGCTSGGSNTWEDPATSICYGAENP